MRTKLPDVRETSRTDEELRDRDREKKAKMKDYADRQRNAEESDLKEGDKVLLKQQRVNKWSASFESQPYEVVEKTGKCVLIKSPEGIQYRRNTTHVKPYCKRENETNDDVPPIETNKESETDDVSLENVPQDLRNCKRTSVNDSPVQSSRPVHRRCLPKKFDDFVME